MKLICDSGSTKADWVLLAGSEIFEFQTDGLNPVHLSEEAILKKLSTETKITEKAHAISELHFFGAGCGSSEGKQRMIAALGKILPAAAINVDNDLMAAALATSGNEKGIIAILGTGSNCCWFDGSKLHLKNYGLGYIIGDEGSGAWFGKNFIRAFLYGMMPASLHDAFYAEHKLDREQIIESTYRKPNANIFLSSFMPFIAKHKSDPFVKSILRSGLEEFFETNIKGFSEHNNSKIHFVGSVAALLETEIRDMGNARKISIGKVLKRPMPGLKDYFLSR